MKNLLLLACCVSLIPASAAADARKDFACQKTIEGARASEIVAAVEANYRELKSLSANFEQHSFLLAGTEGSKSTGLLHFEKPGRMHWRYEKPDKQKFISDGKTFWFYQPEAEQVTVLNFTEAFTSEMPVSFLLGLGELRSTFNVKKLCSTPVGYLLHLLPKTEDEELEEFYLLARNDDYLPIGARVIDFTENETMIRFEDVAINKSLEKSLFTFIIPRGVDVLDQRVDPSATAKAK